MENIDIDMDKEILENIDIDIDKEILENINIDKILNRLEFGISNRAIPMQENLCNASLDLSLFSEHFSISPPLSL